MASPLSSYREIIGDAEYKLLNLAAAPLSGRRVIMVNSTRDGGGVAEILQNMVPLMNELGLKTEWSVVEGNPPFFEMTKTLHNALHGRSEPITVSMQEAFWETTRLNADRLREIAENEIVFIHDPQPAGLIRTLRRADQKWIFRCHVDVSSPFPQAWEFLRGIVSEYDASVFSHPSFARPLAHPQFLISPSIDPLSDKNKPLPESYVRKTLERFNLDTERPLITQISRFDKLKDPVGVIQAYRMVKKIYPAVQLLLAGGGASDDPESAQIMPLILEAAANDGDIHILELPPWSNLDINALQRGSTVILQKSLREGFALTVSEALWKERPVVASAVGGIPLQILHGQTGWLAHSIEGTAFFIRRILEQPEEARAMGRRGREHVRRNFLITRHLREYISMYHCVRSPERNILNLF